MTVPQIYTVVALCIYTALMIFIGCVSYGKSKNLDSFLIGGRNIGAWATAFAYGTTYFSAVVFVGYAGQPGLMELTRTFPAKLTARAWVRAAMPPLAAV